MAHKTGSQEQVVTLSADAIRCGEVGLAP